MLVDVCIEREPVGKRFTRVRCPEYEVEWHRVELIAAPWTIYWVEQAVGTRYLYLASIAKLAAVDVWQLGVEGSCGLFFGIGMFLKL